MFTELRPWCYVTQSVAYAMNSGIILDGHHAALIDPGVTPDEIASIGQFVQERGATVQTIFLTHSHWDHILGAAHFPDAIVVAHVSYGSTVMIEERGLRAALLDWERGAGIERATPFVFPQPDLTFEVQREIVVGRRRLEVQHMPGHHADVFVVYERDSGLLWATDMLSDIEIPFVEQELAAYRRTLAALAPMEIATLVPGHGGWTADPREIRARLERDSLYLDTLQEQVTACLALGMDIDQTIERCMTIPILQSHDNIQAHRDNIETVWLERGGVDDAAMLGWRKYYPA